MRITVLGGTNEVTGSAHLVETRRARVLVDCGLFQGSRELEELNRVPRQLGPGRLDAVVLTHAHQDHTGRLPLLAKRGYDGPVYATPATLELVELTLLDSAKIQKSDTDRANRKRKRAGQPPLEPLYRQEDVRRVLEMLRPLPYNEPVSVADGLAVRVVEAGHMLGSASVELTSEDNGKAKRIAFSGDVGSRGTALLRDPVSFPSADMVFIESTYGDRDHRPMRDTLVEGREAIIRTAAQGGRILIPAFAIGRTQLLLYLIAAMFRNRTVKPFPVFVDSPMAIETTKLYQRHPELLDEEALALIQAGQLRADLATVVPCATAAESRAIEERPGPWMVMAGSGMCTAGRILGHLQRNLSDPRTCVLLVGYQAEGTLGRKLVEGAKTVRIYGEPVEVNAEVHTLNGFSGHAGQTDLLHWFGMMADSRPRTVLIHGADRPREALAEAIRDRYGIRAELPMRGDTLEL